MGFFNARKKSGYTQAEVAEILGVTAASVSQWENGETKPRSSKLPEIAKLLGCTIDELMEPDEKEV